MPEKNKSVVVVGGGPAGMLAALFALRAGARVTLLERNEKLGKKLYITGKGRCNLSNAADGEDFMRQLPHNPRFLYSALRFFDTDALRQLLADLGCDTLVERGQRVFPVSQKSSDVIRSLSRAIEAADIRLRSGLSAIQPLPESGFSLRLDHGDVLRCDSLVLATGGLSYPVTGSTGDGYRFAEALGHKVHPGLPALVPIETADSWPRALQGLTLKNISLVVKSGRKLLFSQQGELLFTHFGISGPLVLSLSSHITGMDLSALDVSLDLKPALNQEQLLLRLQREMLAAGRKQLKSILPSLLPGSLAALFPELCEVDFQKPASQASGQDSQRMAACLKALPIRLSRLRPFSEAVITRGGVDVKQINPSTMASRLVPGLYFAGELIDVDGYTGGFNLQIAFSTGALAGQHAGQIDTKERM